MDFKLDNSKVKSWSIKIIICLISIIGLGISIGLTTSANLGADPISVLFHGASKFTGINEGLIITAINAVLIMIVFFLDRKYVNIGTVIYLVALGWATNLGIHIYNFMSVPDVFLAKIIVSIFGTFLAFISLGAYIAIDIGVDPWSAIAIIMAKKFNKPFKVTRMSFDIVSMIVGYLLGGTVREITLISVVFGGPVIQKMSEILDKVFARMIKSEKVCK